MIFLSSNGHVLIPLTLGGLQRFRTLLRFHFPGLWLAEYASQASYKSHRRPRLWSACPWLSYHIARRQSHRLIGSKARHRPDGLLNNVARRNPWPSSDDRAGSEDIRLANDVARRRIHRLADDVVWRRRRSRRWNGIAWTPWRQCQRLSSGIAWRKNYRLPNGVAWRQCRQDRTHRLSKDVAWSGDHRLPNGIARRKTHWLSSGIVRRWRQRLPDSILRRSDPWLRKDMA